MLRARVGPAVVAVAALALLMACEPTPEPDVPVLIGCDRATERVVLTTSAVLDPGCVYRGGFEIVGSHLTLDCAGAIVEAPSPSTRGAGILVKAPATEAHAHIAVRDCSVRGFLNGMRVTRVGFKALTAGSEYRNGYQDVVIEDSSVQASSGTGIFVDGFVTGVTLQRLSVRQAGGPGIYLEAGSAGTKVIDNDIFDNGWTGAGPEGTSFEVGGTTVRYRSRGREGIAVDGSRLNEIRGNRIGGNASGGIFLYKNCGEYATTKPSDWWTRRYGADDNLIVGNRISNQRIGIWVGSRQDENQQFMDCSDPVILSAPLVRMHEDFARRNVVDSNTLDDVLWGVRVEDDSTVVRNNVFTNSDPTGASIAVGTNHRTSLLAHPVTGTTLAGNSTDLPDSDQPFRWAFGHASTTFAANTAADDPATFAPAAVFPSDVHLFVAELL